MSTRSTISMVNPDGSVTGVYCHSDGYLSHVGITLLTHYNTEETAKELIALGDLSALDQHVSPLPEAPGWGYRNQGKTITAAQHSFETPQEGVVIAYHRDRQEDFHQRKWANVTAWEHPAQHEEYNYLFKGGKWFVLSQHIPGSSKGLELTEELIKFDTEGDDSDNF